MNTLLNQLLQWALSIKNQTQPLANTHTIVGGIIEQIVLYLNILENKIASLIIGLLWKDPVNTKANLYTAYPNPSTGWASLVKDEGLIYSWNGTTWANTGLTAFPSDVATKNDLLLYAKTTTPDGTVVRTADGKIPVVDISGKVDKTIIYNISQANNNYAYADKTAARNAVTANLRGLGQIVTYKLATGWITEQFIGTAVSGWATEANWKAIGEFEVEGIGYRQTTEVSEMINLVVDPDWQIGYLDRDVVYASEAYRYNTKFIPVSPSTDYLTNSRANIAILYYTSANVFISQVNITLPGAFKTPATAAFVRHNVEKSFLNDDLSNIYIYKKPVETIIKESHLSVNIGVGDLQGAVATDLTPEQVDLIPDTTTGSTNYLTPDGKDYFGNNDYFSSAEFLPIKGARNYTTNIPRSSTPLIWFFDSGKRPIQSLSGGTNGTAFGDFTTPINAAYFRFNARTKNVSVFSVFEKTVAEKKYYLSNLVIDKNNVIDNDIQLIDQEVIPFKEGSSIISNQYWGYQNQSAIQGQLIKSLKLKASTAGNVTVVFSGDTNATGIVWSQVFPIVVGENILNINQTLGKTHYILVKGSFLYSTGGANPVGGGLIGPTGTAATSDLCVGVTVTKSMSEGDRQVNYIALGDSITIGQGAVMPYPRLLALSLRGTFSNLGQNGLSATGSGSNSLDSKVALVPAGFKGLITVMIGTNDAGNNISLGDAAITLTKDFANLSKSNFADAFRWNLETLITKCPDAVIVVILSIKFADATNDAKLEKYREVQRIISNHFAIPCLEIYKTCKITFITFPTLMADNTHPNDAGHVEINRVLKPQINLLL